MDFFGAGFSSDQPTRELARVLYNPRNTGFYKKKGLNSQAAAWEEN
jgi:hypothetical protein